MEKSYQQKEITMPINPNEFDYVKAAVLFASSDQKASVRKLTKEEKCLATTQEEHYTRFIISICPDYKMYANLHIYEACIDGARGDVIKAVDKIASHLVSENLVYLK
ncbi:MAG: hypothetical protein PHP54_05930 [Clostridia bacterium]|nr:hypothetical protein [Clostridia bacterium]